MPMCNGNTAKMQKFLFVCVCTARRSHYTNTSKTTEIKCIFERHGVVFSFYSFHRRWAVQRSWFHFQFQMIANKTCNSAFLKWNKSEKEFEFKIARMDTINLGCSAVWLVHFNKKKHTHTHVSVIHNDILAAQCKIHVKKIFCHLFILPFVFAMRPNGWSMKADAVKYALRNITTSKIYWRHWIFNTLDTVRRAD